MRCSFEGSAEHIHDSVSGFAYFDTEDPITITKSVFRLKMHPDADDSSVGYAHTPDGLPLRTTKPDGSWTENVYDANRRRYVTRRLGTAPRRLGTVPTSIRARALLPCQARRDRTLHPTWQLVGPPGRE